jgi:hypothetical protein
MSALTASIHRNITRSKNLNPPRRQRSYPRVVKRTRYNSYRLKRPEDHGRRHQQPPTVRLANLPAQAAPA